MAYTVERLLEIAAAEIGYLEKASNSQLDNKEANAGSNDYTKYARDLAVAGYYNLNGYAWCDMFTDWCFYMLCDKDKEKALSMTYQAGNNGAGCTASMGNYRKAGRLYAAPYKGDQIFFDFEGKGGSTHTGIVCEVTSTTVYVIEGNASGGVRKYKNGYRLTDSRIVGYGRPLYDEATSTSGSSSSSASNLFTPNTEAIQSATEHNFFTVKLKSAKSTEASAKVSLLKDKECNWSYTLTDLTNDSLIADELTVLSADLDNIKLTGLTPYTPYALKITANSQSSQQLFFSTIQDYPEPIENLDCAFDLDRCSCEIKFNSPASWGSYSSFRTIGYRTCLVINGKAALYSDDLIKPSANIINTTKQLSDFNGFNTICYGDILQIGVQTWVKTAGGKLILSRDGMTCSQPFYVKGPLVSIDKVKMKINDNFKRIAIWLNP